MSQQSQSLNQESNESINIILHIILLLNEKMLYKKFLSKQLNWTIKM